MPLVDALFVHQQPDPAQVRAQPHRDAGGQHAPAAGADRPKSQAVMDAALATARIDLAVGVPA